MTIISSKNTVRALSKDAPAAARAEQGQTVTFETVDCYGCAVSWECGQPKETHVSEGRGGNPSTGPLYIEGAEAGDALAVEILDIRVSDCATMTVYPGAGALGDVVTDREQRRFELANGKARMLGRDFDLDPMIGVIGVAPEGEAVGTETPGRHGGNMDCRLIVKGSTLYLPVACPGGLLAAGDVHALMGDGEVAICGLECSAEVDLRASVIKGAAPGWPVLCSGGCWHTLTSAKTLDEAARLARYEMHEFLAARTGHTANELVMLLSVIGQLGVCQVVDPLITARMSVPASAFPGLSFGGAR